MGEIINELVIMNKVAEDQLIKIVGSVSANNLDGISEFTILELKQKYRQMPSLWGVVLKTLKEERLITIGLKNTSSGEPITIGPLLEKNDVLEYQKIGKALPPILTQNMQKVLITVDGFWICLIPSLINSLQGINREITVCGPFTLKMLEQLSLTPADQIIPIETFTALSQEIINSDADTLISLNTPLWQRKVTSLMWSHRVNKYLIMVNNQWI